MRNEIVMIEKFGRIILSLKDDFLELQKINKDLIFPSASVLAGDKKPSIRKGQRNKPLIPLSNSRWARIGLSLMLTSLAVVGANAQTAGEGVAQPPRDSNQAAESPEIPAPTTAIRPFLISVEFMLKLSFVVLDK